MGGRRQAQDGWIGRMLRECRRVGCRPQEVEALTLLYQGCTVQEAADRLGLTRPTCSRMLARTRHRLGDRWAGMRRSLECAQERRQREVAEVVHAMNHDVLVDPVVGSPYYRAPATRAHLPPLDRDGIPIPQAISVRPFHPADLFAGDPLPPA